MGLNRRESVAGCVPGNQDGKCWTISSKLLLIILIGTAFMNGYIRRTDRNQVDRVTSRRSTISITVCCLLHESNVRIVVTPNVLAVYDAQDNSCRESDGISIRSEFQRLHLSSSYWTWRKFAHRLKWSMNASGLFIIFLTSLFASTAWCTLYPTHLSWLKYSFNMRRCWRNSFPYDMKATFLIHPMLPAINIYCTDGQSVQEKLTYAS